MNNNSDINKQKLVDKIISSSGGKINRNMAEKAVSGDTEALLCSLSAENRKKLAALLNDKEAARAFLSSDAAQRLMRSLKDKT